MGSQSCSLGLVMESRALLPPLSTGGLPQKLPAKWVSCPVSIKTSVQVQRHCVQSKMPYVLTTTKVWQLGSCCPNGLRNIEVNAKFALLMVFCCRFIFKIDTTPQIYYQVYFLFTFCYIELSYCTNKRGDYF